MLIVTENDNSNFLIGQFVIMEIIDRTWRYSEIFRNEYFEERQDAYNAIANRGERHRRYSVVETCVIFGI